RTCRRVDVRREARRGDCDPPVAQTTAAFDIIPAAHVARAGSFSMPESASSHTAMASPGPSSAGPVQWLDDVARRDPQHLLLETRDGERLTYSDMAAMSGRIAAALQARGVARGDRVVAQIDKSPEALGLYLACLRVGAAFVPLNTAYT